jgi:hypothetical protein
MAALRAACWRPYGRFAAIAEGDHDTTPTRRIFYNLSGPLVETK